jgi:hypothetical protein
LSLGVFGQVRPDQRCCLGDPLGARKLIVRLHAVESSINVLIKFRTGTESQRALIPIRLRLDTQPLGVHRSTYASAAKRPASNGVPGKKMIMNTCPTNERINTRAFRGNFLHCNTTSYEIVDFFEFPALSALAKPSQLR